MIYSKKIDISLRLLSLAITLFLIFAYSAKGEAGNISVTLTGCLFSQICTDLCHPPASAEYMLVDKSGIEISRGRTNAGSKGFYKAENLIPGETYKLIIIDTAFLFMEFSVEIPNTDKYTEYSRDFLITPKMPGAKILFDVTPFQYKKTKLRTGTNPYIDNICEIVLRNQDFRFTLSCYPDDDNNFNANVVFTLDRCRALKEYFISKGVKPEQLTEEPNESTDPMMPPPVKKTAKGKRYTGSTYLIIKE